MLNVKNFSQGERHIVYNADCVEVRARCRNRRLTSSCTVLRFPACTRTAMTSATWGKRIIRR